MTSKLRAFEDIILNIPDLRELQGSLRTAINDSDIRTEDKRRLHMHINQCNTINDLQRLFYNALLKYEGMGVI
ncbi:hypothetical protein EBZ02_07645 [bacterium]|nr:hypothetical protein [bacterium]